MGLVKVRGVICRKSLRKSLSNSPSVRKVSGRVSGKVSGIVSGKSEEKSQENEDTNTFFDRGCKSFIFPDKCTYNDQHHCGKNCTKKSLYFVPQRITMVQDA